jgi:hypothetical protein
MKGKRMAGLPKRNKNKGHGGTMSEEALVEALRLNPNSTTGDLVEDRSEQARRDAELIDKAYDKGKDKNGK